MGAERDLCVFGLVLMRAALIDIERDQKIKNDKSSVGEFYNGYQFIF
jgi:hypothetical protein